ncbi:MAG: hypothetical protein AAGI52_02425 [Bacteroidota bacterium]
MHPDQTTPDTHRYRAADSLPDETTSTTSPGSAPEVEQAARIAEAGNAYVGRTMSDDLKSHPRVTEPGAAVDDEAL